MRKRSYAEWAQALLIFPGFIVFLALPILWNTHEAWLALGVYLGWVGCQLYGSYQQFAHPESHAAPIDRKNA